MPSGDPPIEPSLAEIAREWGRIGCVGFGGPPAHVALFRELCVERRRWLTAEQFERALAATNLLPGPASTQLAIYCAWRLRGRRGALVGGLGFVLPGLLLLLALSALSRVAARRWHGRRRRGGRRRGRRGARRGRADRPGVPRRRRHSGRGGNHRRGHAARDGAVGELAV